LDKIFTSGYDGNAAKIAIPTGLTTSQFATDPRRINLPASDDAGEAYNNYRPTLEFIQSGGAYTAKYNYKVGGVLKDTTFAFYNDRIFIAPTNLNVMGTVQGKVTVATVTGKSIMPVGDIVYADYNSTTQEVPLNSTNVLGLVSGKQIRYNDQWYKQFKTGSVGQQAVAVGANNTLEINGSLIAVESGSGWKGAGWWDDNRAINYDFRLTGTQMLKAWDPPSNGTKGAQGYLTFNHDIRLISSISPPGYPAVKTTTGLILITATAWSESNTY